MDLQARSAVGDAYRRIVAEVLADGIAVGTAPPGMNAIPEGTAVDRDGSLLFVSAFPDVDGTNVFRYRPDGGTVEPVLASPGSGFASLVIHRDGRLFLCDFFNGVDGGGRIATWTPGDPDVVTLIDRFEGARIVPDDLVFASDGSFYYNDFQGDAIDPVGRVVHVTPDGTQSLVLGGLAHPNGIALTPDEHRLWVSDHLTNRLLAFRVDGAAPGRDLTVYAYLSGGLVDSTTLDSAGNIYQAVYEGGRVEVFDKDANPIAVIVPGADPLANYPNTTHVAIEPGSRRGYLVAGGPSGAAVFGFEALADGLTPYSHR